MSSTAIGPDQLMGLEDQYGARNYHPLDVVLTRGEGVWVWDVAGRRYLDCLAAYSAVNQGHCHPRIVAALTEQAARLTVFQRTANYTIPARNAPLDADYVEDIKTNHVIM